MADLARIKENVARMAGMNAPEADIDGYIASEGVSLDQVRSFDMTPKEPVSTAKDVVNSIGWSGLPKGAIGYATLPAEMGNLAAKGMAWGAKKLLNPTPEQAARLDAVRPFNGYQEAKDKVESVAGPLYEPQTAAGKYASAGAEALVGSPAKYMGASVLGGLAGEGAAQVTDNNPMARMAASLLTTGGISGLQFRNGAAGRATANAMDQVTPDQLKLADALVKRSYAEGAPITGAEAIAKVTQNPNSKLLALQRVTEDSTKGGPTMQEFMAQRPAGNEAMVQRATDAVSPVSEYATIPDRAQRAAEGVIGDIRKQGNQAAEPLYAATTGAGVKVSPSEWYTAAQDSRVLAALAEAKKNPYYGIPASEPEGSLRWLDAAQKILKDKAASFAKNDENYAASLAGEGRKNLLQVTDSAFPDYAQARDVVRQNMEQNVRPAELSPIGKVAAVNPQNGNALTNQFNAIVGSDNATAGEVGKAVSQISAKDGQAARDLVAAGLRNEFDNTVQAVKSGSPMYGEQVAGSKWAAALDTPKVKAAVEALPQGKNAYEGLQNAFEILKAQGMRRPAYNSADAKQALKGGNLAKALRDPTGILGVALENFRYGRDTGTLANLLTNENSVNDLVKLAKLDPGSSAARLLLANALMANKAANSGQ